MTPGIIIPIVLVVMVMAGFYAWYRGKMSELSPDSDQRSVSGARLTAERLRKLSNPPWRVVFEIAETKLGHVDHVVIGPGGVIAIQTVMSDRPAADAEVPNDAHAVADAAIARGDLDDLVRTVGSSCDTLAKVFWGAPQPDRAAGETICPGLVAVEGQRLESWLVQLPPGTLSSAQVDQVWQRVVTGIGRPDPLT